ncbi:hypothetical protein BpHYR1_038421, partial [Brachionus plicatilis]
MINLTNLMTVRAIKTCNQAYTGAKNSFASIHAKFKCNK